jgi:predicted nucleic acid-binding protein
MIVLDTNVISEAFRKNPSAAVRAWLDAQVSEELFLCTPVLAELRYGIERLSAGARRTALEESLSNLEIELFDNRILPFDRTSAHEFGRVVVRRNGMGRPIATMDALIAAIAISHRMMLATRDTGDFADLGLDLINPFESVSAR